MNALGLFDGIAGFGLGLEQAGMEVVGQVELDRDCQNVLARHYPDVPRWADITEVNPDDLPRADLVCGGFPCQDLSVAGRRQGLAGERSGLWWQFWRILAAVRPRWFMVENVPGLLSAVCPDPDAAEPRPSREYLDAEFALAIEERDEPDPGPGACPGGCMAVHGGAMGVVLGSLAELGYGYAYRVLDAQHFGLAQRRRRVFIVGCLGDWTAPATVLFEPEGGPGDPAPRRTAGTGVAAGAAGGTGGTRPGDWPESDGVIAAQCHGGSVGGRGTLKGDGSLGSGVPFVVGGAQQDQFVTPDGIAPTLAHSSNTHGGHHQPMVVGFHPTQTPIHAEELSPALSANMGGMGVSTVGTLGTVPPGGGWRVGADEAAVGQLIAVRTNQTGANGHGFSDDLTNTLDQAMPQAVLSSTAVRRLTPIECERLQGFPDNWTAGQADSVRYRQLGNAVPVPVVRWIGERIMRHDADA